MDNQINTPQSVIDRQATTKERIYKYLENGLFFRDACIASGIDESTGHRWKQKDATFASRVEANIIKYKQKLIQIINAGAINNPKIALEILRIRWTGEWNTRKKVELVDPEKELKRIESLIYGHNITP